MDSKTEEQTDSGLDRELRELKAQLGSARRELQSAARRARLCGGLALAALALTGLLNIRPAAFAQSPGVTLASLVARIQALEARAPVPGPQGPKGDQGPAGKNGHDGLNGKNGQNGKDGAQGPAGPGFSADKVAILNTMALSDDPNAGGTNTLLTITGVNVQIVNGLGATDGQPVNGGKAMPAVNGLGNLIVGYDEPSQYYATARGGSHNLIVGTGNNYSSYGGLVAGSTNAIGAPFAAVTGGFRNLASGLEASVSGGDLNVASGAQSSVTGGIQNTAGGVQASVTGGALNAASGLYTCVAAGEYNSAYGSASSITGGQYNVVGDSTNPGTPSNVNATGALCAIGGGQSNTATGNYTTVSGGQSNTATGNYTTVSGGVNRYQSHDDGWTGGHYATDGP